jgi:hypothetical protein
MFEYGNAIHKYGDVWKNMLKYVILWNCRGKASQKERLFLAELNVGYAP